MLSQVWSIDSTESKPLSAPLVDDLEAADSSGHSYLQESPSTGDRSVPEKEEVHDKVKEY